MPRDITSTMQDAMDQPGSYSFLARATAYRSNIFFTSISQNHPVSGADAQGVVDDPMGQDIVYTSTSNRLITFFSQGGNLKYSRSGNTTAVTTVYDTSVKPGVGGTNKLFLFNGTAIKRYLIDFALINTLSTNPLTEEASITPDDTPTVIHGISATECVSIFEDSGGFRVTYVSGTTQKRSNLRFVFPNTVEWEGSSRTMESLAKSSTAAKLGNKIFVYMSAAHNGMVQGMYYDNDTDSWSDSFIALPTDISVSLCEFRVANSFSRNGKIYMCGMFIRKDAVAGSQPYTLIMGSNDGMTFAIDRFCLVTALGYRFHAHVGTDNNLYIANCNRVGSRASTWVFDGNDLTNSQKLELGMAQIVSIQAGDITTLSMELKGGEEAYINSNFLKEGCRIVLETGYETSIGQEWVTYGTYIIESATFDRVNVRSFTIQAIHEGRWKMSGLSMPFYAEITGISSTYDSMNEQTGLLYAAPSHARYSTKFWVDFWKHKGYTNATYGITGKKSFDGGCSVFQTDDAHKIGFILDGDVADILGVDKNPEITGTSLTIRIYGWSRPLTTGQPNDEVNLILVTTDADGNDRQLLVSNDDAHWPVTYPYQDSGSSPITMTVIGMEPGRLIKSVGLVFESAYGAHSVPWRVEFTNNVKVPVILPETGLSWEKQDDGTFAIPGTGAPFVMFSQKPYNAFNFSLSGKFTNSVEGGITGYPVTVGLVGLGQDAGNFVVGRFDKVSGKAQLVKVRGGIETILEQDTPPFAVGDAVSIMFQHRDGRFQIYILDDTTNTFKRVINYEWRSTDGYICTSSISSLKCGIYGSIESPMVQILGFSYMGTDKATVADGIAVAPMGSVTKFPTSGELRIGTNIYSYTSKVPMPAYVRGPSQLRQQGKYSPPFGNGKYGLQCYDMDWHQSPSKLEGFLLSCDSACFIHAGTNWQPFITTGGVKQYLPNRSQHYSDNPQVAKFMASVTTRVWVTGGFTGISLVKGKKTTHALGEYARLELGGTITCHWFMGAGGELEQTTVQDLLGRVCALSGVNAVFPGSFTSDSVTIDGVETLFVDDYAEGFDLSFDLDGADDFQIIVNAKVKPDNYEEKDLIENDTGLRIYFSHLGSGEYDLTIASNPSLTPLFKTNFPSYVGYQKLRFLLAENILSMFRSGRWIATVTFDELIYGNSLEVEMSTATPVEFKNVVAKELCDLREAVYIDLETDGTAAISAIIQERPINIIPLPDGSLQFFYTFDRPYLDLNLAPVSHSEMRKIPPDAASDAIVYGSKEVKTLQYEPFAQILGLSTKLYRLPDLNVGAFEAAVRMLDKAFQRSVMTRIVCRPQLHVLLEEYLDFTYTLAGLNKNSANEIIVESINLTFTNNGKSVESSMVIEGRQS